MVTITNTRPMAENLTKNNVRGLKYRLENLQILPEKPKDEINHKAALFSLDEEKRPISLKIQSNEDKVTEQKLPDKQNNQEAIAHRLEQVQKDLMLLKKEGFVFGEKQTKQLLARAKYAPLSNDPNDPMRLKEQIMKLNKIIEIISGKNLSAEKTADLFERHAGAFRLPGFGEIKNKRPDLRKAVLFDEAKKKPQIRENIQHQINFEKENPKLFTNLAAGIIKNNLGNG